MSRVWIGSISSARDSRLVMEMADERYVEQKSIVRPGKGKAAWSDTGPSCYVRGFVFDPEIYEEGRYLPRSLGLSLEDVSTMIVLERCHTGAIDPSRGEKGKSGDGSV